MFSLLLLVAGMNCTGPFVPPVGFDSENKPVQYDYEVAVGPEDIATLTAKATELFVQRQCLSGHCEQPKLWQSSSEHGVNCVMVVAEKQQPFGVVVANIQLNNQKTFNSYNQHSTNVNNTFISSGAPTVASQPSTSLTGSIAIVGGGLVLLGVGAGIVGVASLVDAADGLYFEPNSPDVTMFSLILAGATTVVGGGLIAISRVE